MESYYLINRKLEEYPLISVIVPVYKVEKYLDKCIKSITNQTYTNLEIILVDDGSPDKCGMLCDLWCSRDKRIKVIHKKNGGLSDARNVGITEARGKYVGFVDSDDYIEPDMYERLMYALIETQADISTCYAITEINGESTCVKKNNRCFILNSYEALEDLFVQNKYLRHAAWNKLYCREIFMYINFPVGRLFEDAAIMYRIFTNIQKIVCLDSQLYHYVIRDGSITNNKYNIKSIKDQISNGMEAMSFFENNAKVQKAVYCWNTKCFPLLWEKAYENNDDITCEYIIKCFRSITTYTRMWFLKKKLKMHAILFVINPNLYYMIKRLRQKNVTCF